MDCPTHARASGGKALGLEHGEVRCGGGTRLVGIGGGASASGGGEGEVDRIWLERGGLSPTLAGKSPASEKGSGWSFFNFFINIY